MRCKWLIVAALLLAVSPAFAQRITEHNQERAKQIAQQRGWWTRYVDSNGRAIELQYIEHGRPFYYITHNRHAADTVSTDECWPGGSSGFGLTGSGVTLGIWDAGAVKIAHPEFEGRATQIDNLDPNDPNVVSDHATHVSGTLIAAGTWHGNAQYPAGFSKGMSYQANLNCYDWNGDKTEMAAAAEAGLRASNHSYGLITGWYCYYFDGYKCYWFWWGDATISDWKDYRFGRYDDEAQSWDQVAFDHPFYLPVKAAGNDRDDNGPAPGEDYLCYDPNTGEVIVSNTPRSPDGPYDCIEGGGIAKNVLTVAAVDDVIGGYQNPLGVQMTTFSSWGPADDSRIKPDISANGYELFSTYSGPDCPICWAVFSGTSMASPNVTGSLGLLIQHWRATHSARTDMRAATLKALVIHTADECGTAPGPDYSFGWGLLNTLKAAQTISLDANQSALISEQELSTANAAYSVEVACTGTDPELRATLCWTDPPGTPPGTYPDILLDDPTPMLVNDLDLRIIGCDGTEYYPWVLTATNPSAPAIKADNSTDNVEQVVLLSPGPGLYTVTVSHKGTLTGDSQAFSLVITGQASPDCHIGGPTSRDDTDCNGDGIRDSCQAGLAPAISRHPTPTTACPDQRVTLTVGTAGACPLEFQWRKDGAPIAGATSAALVIAAASADDEGSYSVTVGNPCGATVVSHPAALTVRPATVIVTDPQPETAALGDTLLLTVAATGPEPLTYQWRKNGQPLAGATRPSYQINSVQLSDAGEYDAVVTSICTSLESARATLSLVLSSPAALSPSNGAIEVLVDADLKWNGVYGANTYDVYFGTTSPLPLVGSTGTTGWKLPTLDFDTIYQWKLVARATGATGESAVWSFRTQPGPPTEPIEPSPADGATDVAPSINLSWSGGEGGVVYNLLMGKDSTLKDAQLEGTTLSKHWAKSALASSTTYYWRVIAKSEWGTAPSAVWSFTTAAAPNVPDSNSPAATTPTDSNTPGQQNTTGTTPTNTTPTTPEDGNTALTSPANPSALCPTTSAAMISAMLLGFWSTRPRRQR